MAFGVNLREAFAQLSTQTTVPSWVGNLVLGNSLISGDPSSTQEELPGLGHKFELLFAMEDSKDPLNPTNDVISVDTTGGAIGVAHRDLPPGIKIDALTSQINLKYLFEGMRTCGGGSPRIDLAIDCDGDGRFDANAFGYVGHGPFGTGCLGAGKWDIVDMTDETPRWDLSQIQGGMTLTWESAVAYVNTRCPNHKILYGQLTDDSSSFSQAATGKAFYDLLTIENRTLENDQDTVKNGK